MSARRADGLLPATADDRCGTPRGHTAHRRRGEEPCDACRAAWNDYMRPRQRARQRAQTRLRALYPLHTGRVEALARAHRSEWIALLRQEESIVAYEEAHREP